MTEYPIPLTDAQESSVKEWAADDRLWTTQETVEFNLRTFARTIMILMGKCIKCGTNFVGTPENPPPDGLCKYCQIDALKADNSKLRKALVGLVGADSKGELEKTEAALRMLPVPDEDRVNTINAIHALRDTLPATSAMP